jgi:chaperonin cofactor prefoldin
MVFAASLVGLLLLAGLPAQAQTSAPTGTSSITQVRAQLDAVTRRLSTLQSQLSAHLTRLDQWRGRALAAEQTLVSMHQAVIASGLSVHTPLGSVPGADPLLIAYRDAKAAYQRLRRVPVERHEQAVSGSLQAEIASLQSQQQSLQGRLDELEKANRAASSLSRGSNVSVTSGAHTYGGWARLFLSGLGAPDCGDNLLVVVAWEAQEGTSAAFNPLATTHDMPGATNFNSVGVKNYVSLQQGVQATIETLVGGSSSYGYGAVIDALRSCAGASATAQWVNASSWCRGCGGGNYLVGLLPIVAQDYAAYANRPL